MNARNVVATNGQTISQPHINNCCFGNGWMVLSDEIAEFDDQYLRFYKFNDLLQRYELHTRIDHPHTREITSLSMRGNCAVSTSKDGAAKVWKFENDHWELDNVFTYKGLEALKCCFSSNSDVLAVSFSSIITIWNLESGELITTMSFGYVSNIHNLGFVGEDCIVGCDNNLMQVWNYKTQTGMFC